VGVCGVCGCVLGCGGVCVWGCVGCVGGDVWGCVCGVWVYLCVWYVGVYLGCVCGV